MHITRIFNMHLERIKCTGYNSNKDQNYKYGEIKMTATKVIQLCDSLNKSIDSVCCNNRENTYFFVNIGRYF